MNKSNDSKNSTRRRRVLVASILLAGLITIGGTFAWFTSKDEVTNKLTSTSNYGVSIVESFKPPKNWVPGQTVTKQAGVTNTGNVDAFAKVTLSSFIDVTVKGANAYTYGRVNSSDDKELKLTTLKETLASQNRSLVELSSSLTTSSLPDTEAKSKDEVQSIQAGGRLIYGDLAPTGKIVSFGVIPYENDTIVGDTYTPTHSGLYIFERQVSATSTDDGVEYTYQYSGYYYVWTKDGGTYYAVDIPSDAIERDETNPAKVTAVHLYGESGRNATNSVGLKTTKLLQNNELYFEYDTNNKSGNNPTSTGYIFYDADKEEYYLKAIYYGEGESSTNNTNTANDIAIRIYLNDIYKNGDTNNPVNWSINSSSMYYDSKDSTNHASETATFYLNQVLMAGETSNWVITGVEIDPDVDDEAYVSFDYNLTLTADSIQVVYDSDGNIVTFDNNATDDAGKNSISASAVNGEWEDDQAQVTKITKNTTGTPEYSVTWSLKSSKGIT